MHRYFLRGPRQEFGNPGLEVIKLEFILKLKIKGNDWLLADSVLKQPIIALYFEFENVLKLYNLEARTQYSEEGKTMIKKIL